LRPLLTNAQPTTTPDFLLLHTHSGPAGTQVSHAPRGQLGQVTGPRNG